MPLQSEAQIVGYEGERWFRSVLPRGWILQRPETDVGVDFLVVVSEDSELDKREFRCQVKSSKLLMRRGDSIVIRRIKRSTLDYWFLSPVPTLIVAYDVSENRGFFTWHNQLFEHIREKLTGAISTVSITVPTANELNEDGWDTIKENLRWHYRNLATSLAQARDARSLLPTIHDLAAAARQLNSIDHQPIPVAERTDQQEGILALIEIMHYRLVATTLSNLRSELLPASEGETRLRNWISAFEARVESVFPTFRDLTDWQKVSPEFQLTYAKNLIHEQRYKLIEVILEMIMLLAPGRFNKQA